ncbi:MULTISPECIES: hypothetical protein [Bacillus]|uniref:hypothetical protein n=1 Tax=Bacillus TaxID=1386 RepID=UPI00030AE374|nr:MULTISPECIES: hypothetical protein [Bacillus]
MTRINDKDRDIIENEIYLPMLIIILERDKKVIEQSPFKLKNPYLELVENTISSVNKDLKATRNYLRNNNIKVYKRKSDEMFTQYSFSYKGHQENHNYFNPRLKNRCEELLQYYFNKALL